MLAAIAAFLCAFLAWGYWHALRHGAVMVAVNDVSLKNDRQAYGQVRSAELAFLDDLGRVLARARLDEPHAIVSFQHPDVGDCRREERAASSSAAAMEAWHRCFETHSRWFMTWVTQARQARVKLAACTIDPVPVYRRTDADDWWLWWVPAAHVGGKPYTHFTLEVWIDARNCRAVGRER